MSYTYAGFQNALALEMIIPNANVNDANFQAILPTIVDEAEQRCYRDLDLLYATTAQTVLATAGLRKLDLSSLNPYLLILEELNVIIPSTVTDPELGTRTQCYPKTKDYLDAVYDSSAVTGVPQHYAMLTDKMVLFGPWPDEAYTVELIGKFRPTPIYNVAPQDGTQTTWLSTNLPDLFLAAAMISASAYRHNFGAQADDPRMAVSWEQRYQQNLASAKGEESRKKMHYWGVPSPTAATVPTQTEPT